MRFILQYREETIGFYLYGYFFFLHDCMFTIPGISRLSDVDQFTCMTEMVLLCHLTAELKTKHNTSSVSMDITI